MPIRGFLLDRRRNHVEVIEPRARLIDALGDKFRRKSRVEFFRVLKRIVCLRIRHRARIKPRIEYIRHAPHHAIALFTRYRDLIHDVLVQITHFFPARLFQFPHRSKNPHLPALAFPYRHHARPIPLATDRPVSRAFEPFAETPFFDMCRHPLDVFRIFERVFFDR